MNAMPMIYAKKLKEAGQDVIYFVDVPEDDALSRPESRDRTIFPYPNWIVEFVIRYQILVAFLPRIWLWLMIRRARKKGFNGEVKAVVLSGFFINFARCFPKDVRKIFLSFGADLDSWCNDEAVEAMFPGMRHLSLFQYLPNWLGFKVLKHILRGNFRSAESMDAVIYFPPGMNQAGDRIVERLTGGGVRYIPRFDVSFEPLTHADRTFRETGGPLVILSPVRFTFRTFSEGNLEYSKGNDNIIRGIALYKKENPNIEVHFFEKGQDVEDAKALCEEVGISDIVVWHPQVPFLELGDLYERSDICFDQVGNHIVGSGIYALYMGKPLIANASNLGFLGNNPIQSATCPEEVYQRLVALSGVSFRRQISDWSKRFAEEKLGPGAVLEQLTGTNLK